MEIKSNQKSSLRRDSGSTKSFRDYVINSVRALFVVSNVWIIEPRMLLNTSVKMVDQRKIYRNITVNVTRLLDELLFSQRSITKSMKTLSV